MSTLNRTFRKLALPLYAGALVAGAGFVIVSCSNSTLPPGGPLFGMQDTHCTAPNGTMITQITSQADCQTSNCANEGPPCSPDAGPPQPDAAVPEPEFGATMFNNSGNDDDCKYFVTWTSTPIQQNTNVFFTVVATTTVAPGPATGANIFAEVYLDNEHEAPPTNQAAVESPPGTYKVGPILFDAAGAWTVRFHLNENCKDLVDDSPHGHAAFYVDVP